MNELVKSFIDEAKLNRTQIKAMAEKVKAMHERDGMLMQIASPEIDTGEMHANITLAYRHLEDAAMRLGKAIQAADGGVSIYDK
jgi:hypothetical protein